ncbi:MAG TPA: DUF4241 domain-containing protein [Trebonia sp.]
MRRDQVDLGQCEVRVDTSTAETDDGLLVSRPAPTRSSYQRCASAAAFFAHQPRGWLGQSGLPRLAFTAPASDPGSSANLIAYHSGRGDGSYPVWIGRSADGEVACFLADMQLMPDNVALGEN